MERDSRDLKQMFMQKKPSSIMLAIARVEKPYVSLLMKEADTTFAHTTNILSDMEACGLVEFVSEGRVKYVRLTRRGKDVVRSLQQLEAALDGAPLLKDLKRLEGKINGIEQRIKAGGYDEKAAARHRKSLGEATAKATAIGLEAQVYRNDHLDYELKVMNERMEYLKTRLEAGAGP